MFDIGKDLRDAYEQGFRDGQQAMWIPCSERLPHAEYGESNTVIVTKCWNGDEEMCFVGTSMFDGGNWCEPTGERLTVTKVVAWMPMPEPYREDGEA